MDLEATYSQPVSALIPDWSGNFRLHGLMTFWLRNYQTSPFAAPTNHVGENNPNQAAGNGQVAPPHWRLNVSATYSLDPLTVTLTGRAVSSGAFNTTYIQCTSGCPAATAANPTINNNHMPGRAYLDASVAYNLPVEDATVTWFLTVKNVFNNDPPPLYVQSYLSPVQGTQDIYDTLGTVFRTGIRFRM